MPKIALAQLSLSENLPDNMRKTIAAMSTASKNGADLIVFPEVQFSPFFPRNRNSDAKQFLFDIDHECVRNVRSECRRLRLMSAINIYLAERGKEYDASVLIDKKGQIVGTSKMVHITQAENFYEQDYYAPSAEGFRVYSTPIGMIGIEICFDRHYPESIRCSTLLGADIILVPTVNMVGEPLEMFEWEMRVAAYHNSVYIAMCNRVGVEGHVEYCGQSLLVDPRGDVVLRGNNREDVLCAEFDLDLVRNTRSENKYLDLYRPENFTVSAPSDQS